MTNLNRLAEIIDRLKEGEDPGLVRHDAQEFLATIDAADLTFAEQQLVDAGLAPEDLKHLCSVHMQMLEGEVEKLKASLPPGHLIHTMVCKHEAILGFLDELERVNQAIQSMDSYDAAREEFKKLAHIAHHLIETELHHQREEDVLFPNVESRGLFGPPQVMRMEHVELRARKKELHTLAEQAGQIDFAQFKKRLDTTSKFIVMTLRDHIFKENNILYPASLQVIGDDEQWERMREQCDSIGYCCFTPQSARK